MVNILGYCHSQNKKRRGALLLLVLCYKGSRIACLIRTSNTRVPTPMYVYSGSFRLLSTCTIRSRNGLYITPHRTSLLLSFARLFWICEILIVQNKSVQLRQFHYVCPLLCRCWYTYYHWALTRTSTNIAHSFEKRCFFSKYLWHKLIVMPYATIVCVSKGASAWRERCFLSYCLFFLIVKRAN